MPIVPGSILQSLYLHAEFFQKFSDIHVIHILILFQQQMFKQQQKMFQQARVVQSQRLKTIKQLHDQFTKVKQLSLTTINVQNQTNEKCLCSFVF